MTQVSKRFLFLSLISAFILHFPANSEVLNAEVAPVVPEQKIQYKGEAKYYVTPSGEWIRDKRKVGPINPNLFDVVRGEGEYKYIASEDEDKGCNLEKLFVSTIYQKQGFDSRRFLNALATPASSCNSLPSAEEQKVCIGYHSNPACQGATPLVFYAIPLPPGASYLTYEKTGSCEALSQPILKDIFVAKQSKEWSKIYNDLLDKKRSNKMAQLKASAPVGQIRQTVLAKNGSASQREVDFAVNDWVYTEAKKASFEIADSEIQSIVEERYTPSAAIKNVIAFRSEIGGKCGGKEARYKSKVFSEGVNIPAQHTLLFNDFVDPANGCVCKK
jgi:hypothetical protein